MVGQTVSRAGIGRSMATRSLVGASAAVVVLALCAAGCRTPAFKPDGGTNDLGAADLAGADTPADMLADTPADMLGDTPADMLLVPSASCTMLPANCGSDGADNCCNSPLVSGGMFKRSYDVAIDNAYPDQTHPATVSDFRLDKYEVTVGRFRNFVNAGMGTQASPPAAGAGANPYIASSGWDTSFNSSLTANTAALIAAVKCDATTYQNWTDAAGPNENMPMNCITWFEAMAFCAWDGGFLPTEAEWNYAASGGSEQRAYPWSNPPSSVAIDCSYANYNIDSPSGTRCVNGTTGGTSNVGSESPKGDGKWGQSDLAGNVWEWTLDWAASPYADPCDDCANLTMSSPFRVIRGGGWNDFASFVRPAYRDDLSPASRGTLTGVRCARTK